MSLERLVKQFNENPTEEFLRIFGAPNEPIHEILPKFLALMDKRGLYDDLEIYKLLANHHYLTNTYFKYLYDSGRGEEFIKNLASAHWKDIKYDDGKIYLVLSDKDELSYFFCPGDGGRNDIDSVDIVRSVFGEDYWEPYNDTTQDVFHDVIEELDETNINYLCNYISKEIKQISLKDGSDKIYGTIIPELADNQGHDDYLVLTPEIVRELILVKPTFNVLLPYLGDNFEYSLYSVHSQAYNQAVIDEQNNRIWSELEKLGISKGKYVEHGKYITADITSFYENVIVDYLEEFNGYSDDPAEYSSFVNLFERLQEYSSKFGCLHVRIVEYANHRFVRKYINDFFRETIYI